MRFERIDGKSNAPNEDRKIRPLDLPRLKSRELKEQQGLPKSKNDEASQKLESIHSSMRQTYEWVLRQRYPRLTGEELEEAIWKLHEYRQEEGSNPDKTVVTPDKSDTQKTLVGQTSHWSSSDTMVSSDGAQAEGQDGESLKEKLRESFRSVVQEYRQEGKVRSTAPTLRNMTEGQILLEALSHSDWLDKLQKKGVEVNKRTLELISQKLQEADHSKPSDYNPAVRNFSETLDKFNGKDIAALRVEPVGRRGGGYFKYHQDSQKYYGRIITLKDPNGYSYKFEAGQEDISIACYTTEVIEYYSRQYGIEQAQKYINYYQLDPGLIQQYAEEYKVGYDKGKSLTETDVSALQSGEKIKGWECTECKYIALEKTVFYTDKGFEIPALDLSLYKPYSIEQHSANIPHPPIGNPTPRFNCLSEFIGRQLWVVAYTTGNEIQKILDHNGYYDNTANPQVDNLVCYGKPGEDLHIGIVVEGPNGLRVESKPGDFALILHDLYDPWVIDAYGPPTVYATGRGSHMLRTTPP